MAWCPKCKNEYREGVDVCPDCDVPLVDELPEEEDVAAEPKPVVLMRASDREIGEKIVRFLRYNGIISSALATGTFDADSGESDTDETNENQFAVIVADLDMDAACELFPGLAEGEEVYEDRLYEMVPDIEDQLEEVENEQASKEFSELRSEASTVYVKKKDKYADLRFSGLSFIGFGIIGVVIVLLNLFHVINLFNVYSMIVMSLVFVVFFIIGFRSLIRAGRVKESVAVEDEFTQELNEWIDENLSDDVIDEWYDENREDQENYFEIQAKITNLVHEHFPNIHPSYIEELAEERYTSYLERSAYESPEDVPEADDPDDSVTADEVLNDDSFDVVDDDVEGQD
ncbi:MAG: hypothetical protein J5819_08625 [Eubacterium sp.]|nr:hypothetical protein [Eubacterium sp.]